MAVMTDFSDLSLLAGQTVALAEAFRDGRRTRQVAIKQSADLLATLVTFDRSLLRWAVRELIIGTMSVASAVPAATGGVDYLIRSVRHIQRETAAQETKP